MIESATSGSRSGFAAFPQPAISFESNHWLHPHGNGQTALQEFVPGHNEGRATRQMWKTLNGWIVESQENVEHEKYHSNFMDLWESKGIWINHIHKPAKLAHFGFVCPYFPATSRRENSSIGIIEGEHNVGPKLRSWKCSSSWKWICIYIHITRVRGII